jgi:hypothetical protein
MDSRAHPAFAALFVLVVAPLGAAVVIAALLLFGVEPRLVFAPGHAVRAFLAARGVHAPNTVGVLTTVAVFWAIITLLGLAWSRWRKSK